MTDTEKKRMSPDEYGRVIGRALGSSSRLSSTRSRITYDRPNETKPFGPFMEVFGSGVNGHHDIWRADHMSDDIIDSMNADEMMEFMIDRSPEVSRAAWDITRLFLAGYEINVYKPGTKTIMKRGKKEVDMFINRLETLYGTFEVPLTRIVMGALTRGAFFAELIIGEDGRTPVDLATPDPALVYFRKAEDRVRGQIWEMGQLVNGEFESIESERVRYIPIDPFPGKPYGRSPLMPGLNSALFLLTMMADMKRIVRQQGYPRIDISVNVEEMNDIIESGSYGSEDELVDALVAAVDAAIMQVESQYADVPPDAAYVHSSLITINGIVGAIDAGFMQAVDSLIEALERHATRAMKMMPLLMGVANTSDEGDANRQWEIMVKSVKSLQHRCEIMLGYLFKLGLQASGIDADVEVRFAELRVAELMRDTQVDQLRAATAAANERYGYMGPDEASIYSTGHPIPDEVKAKRIPLLNEDTGDKDMFGQVGLGDAEPDPAENK